VILLACAIAVLASGVFSGLETGLYATSRLRVVLDAAAGHPRARRAQQLLGDLPRVLTVLLIANNVTHWASSLLVQIALERHGFEQTELLGTVVVTAVLFIFGESVPKSAFRRGQQHLLYPALPLLSGTYALLAVPVAPVARLADWMARRLARRVGSDAVAHAGERDALLRTGAAEGLLTPFQQRVARGVLAMRSRTAGEEARPVGEHPTARLGHAGVAMPDKAREHRVVVLDEAGQRIVGWTPLAALWEPGGFRPPARRDLRPIARVEPDASLDSVYMALDRTGAPFAGLTQCDQLKVLDGNLLRRRVMGTFAASP
jgi:CBS domain containing-hemolysin-like protein